MNFRILVLKTGKRADSKLFHSIIVNGIDDFFKKLKFGLRRGMQISCQA